MAENKRYYIGNGKNCTICDSNQGGSDFYNMLTQFEAVDRLNEQEEEIQELKTENKQLNQFINGLTTKGTGRIDLANGYSYKINAVLTDFCGDVE